MSPTSKRQPIQFGKYLLLDRINIGGMAEVWRGKTFGPSGAERLVAIKRILPNIAEDEEFNSMFIFEAKISVQLTHANIGQIFDLGQISNSLFIAMEYISGRDMRAIFDRCRKQGEPAPIPLVCHVISQMCDGLDYAHRKKDANGEPMHIVHRDVSPANVLVSYDGDVKVIDFGIAKAAGKATRTQAGILKGKFAYMSPEQLLSGEIDYRADIFAIGICLFEMLTGERLFVGESDFAVLEKVRDVVVPAPSSINPRIPEELERITLKALAGDRDQRYQHASDLAVDLRRYMDSGRDYFGRKELAAYMRETFADELEREEARLNEYAEIKRPEGMVDAPVKTPARSESSAAVPKPRPSLTGIPVLVQPPRRTSTSMPIPAVAPAEELEATGVLEADSPAVAAAVNAARAEEAAADPDDEEDESASTLMIGHDVVRAALGPEPGTDAVLPAVGPAPDESEVTAAGKGPLSEGVAEAPGALDARGVVPGIPVLTPSTSSAPAVVPRPAPVLTPAGSGLPPTLSSRPAYTPKPQSLESRRRPSNERPALPKTPAKGFGAPVPPPEARDPVIRDDEIDVEDSVSTLKPIPQEPDEVTDPHAISHPPLPPPTRPVRPVATARTSREEPRKRPIGLVVSWAVTAIALVAAVIGFAGRGSTPKQGYLYVGLEGPPEARATAVLDIDGKNLGRQPSWPVLRQVPVGEAVVLVSAPGFRAVTQKVKVSTGSDPAQVSVALQPLHPKAHLVVVADSPDAHLSVNGTAVERRPGADAWISDIPVGKDVTVEARADGRTPSTKKAHADSAGQVVVLRFELAPKTRAVSVSSEPPGAEIVVAGEVVGTTPGRVQLASDVRSITLRKHCFGDAQVAVEPAGDEDAPLSVQGTLKPKPDCR